jgi:hypothetical protein
MDVLGPEDAIIDVRRRSMILRVNAHNKSMNNKTTHILICNNITRPVTISRHACLGLAGAPSSDGRQLMNASLRVPNSIRILREPGSADINAFTEACEEFPELFTDKGTTVNIPPGNHMRILLIPGQGGIKLDNLLQRSAVLFITSLLELVQITRCPRRHNIHFSC